MIKGKQPEEIRKLFNIVRRAVKHDVGDNFVLIDLGFHAQVNDFTPEEEAQIRKENEWAEVSPRLFERTVKDQKCSRHLLGLCRTAERLCRLERAGLADSSSPLIIGTANLVFFLALLTLVGPGPSCCCSFVTRALVLRTHRKERTGARTECKAPLRPRLVFLRVLHDAMHEHGREEGHARSARCEGSSLGAVSVSTSTASI